MNRFKEGKKKKKWNDWENKGRKGIEIAARTLPNGIHALRGLGDKQWLCASFLTLRFQKKSAHILWYSFIKWSNTFLTTKRRVALFLHIYHHTYLPYITRVCISMHSGYTLFSLSLSLKNTRWYLLNVQSVEITLK